MFAGKLLLALVISVTASSAIAAHVVFDLPSSIECRDVTPADFTADHPGQKVIEARFRVSARITEGSAGDLVDFVYILNSPQKTLHLQDYLPNTTLESAVAEDQIEITAANENASVTGAEAHVAYKIFTLGATHNQSTKKAESSRYRQIAAKELVLASGTTNRQHGVFFRLRPSRAGSLEGAKEFTFLATVPKTWRADICAISCSARAKKNSLVSTSIAPSGSEEAQVGLYLAGDAEAAELAAEFSQAQEAYATALAHPAPKESVLETFSSQAAGFFTGKKHSPQPSKEFRQAAEALAALRDRLEQLAK